MKVKLNSSIEYQLESANENFSLGGGDKFTFMLILTIKTDKNVDQLSEEFTAAGALKELIILDDSDAIFNSSKYLNVVSINTYITPDPYATVVLSRTEK